MSPWTSERHWRRGVAALTARWRRAELCYLKSLEEFRAWCMSHAGGNCRLVVSTSLLHELNFEAGLPLHGEAERLAYARHQFVHYFGTHAQRWRLGAWAGGASALHGIEWEQLQETARRHQVRLVNVEPVWGPLLRGLGQSETEWATAPQSALAWVEGEHLSWLVVEHGSLKEVRKLRMRAATTNALLDAVNSLRVGKAQSVLIAGYGLADASPIPDARTLSNLASAEADLTLLGPAKHTGAGLSSVDLLGQRFRRPLLAWTLLATSVMVLLTAGWNAREARDAMLNSEAQLALLESRVHAHAPSAATLRPPSVNSRKTEAEVDRSARDVQATLAWAWEPVLAGVEELGASSSINWMGMDASATRSEIRLEGQAPERMSALHAVDRLGATSGWHQVMLGRLQQADASQSGQRFDVSARLQSKELKAPAPVSAGAPLKEGA